MIKSIDINKSTVNELYDYFAINKKSTSAEDEFWNERYNAAFLLLIKVFTDLRENESLVIKENEEYYLSGLLNIEKLENYLNKDFANKETKEEVRKFLLHLPGYRENVAHQADYTLEHLGNILMRVSKMLNSKNKYLS